MNEYRIVDGSLIVDMKIEKDKMPQPERRNVDLSGLLSSPFPTTEPQTPKQQSVGFPGATETYIPAFSDEPVVVGFAQRDKKSGPVRLDPKKHKLVFNYPAGNNTARLQQEMNATQVKGCQAVTCPRDPNGDWPAVEQVPVDWTPPANPNPVVSKAVNDAMRAIEEATRTPRQVFWSLAMQRDPVVASLFHEYVSSGSGTFEDFLTALCVELWKERNKLIAEILKEPKEKP